MTSSGDGEWARQEQCDEYLGRELGYCDGAAQVFAINGRGFCTDHAKERDL